MGGATGAHRKSYGQRALLDIEAVDIRDYTQDKDRRVDDYTYGGGAGHADGGAAGMTRMKRLSEKQV